jgi:hypothetical protein
MAHQCDKEAIIATTKAELESANKRLDESIAWLEKSLKDYFQAKLDGIDKATVLREIALDKRLETMNEFRGSLKDQQGSFVTRNEYEVAVRDIRDLRESRAKLEGKADQSYVNRVLFISILGIIVSIVAIIIHLIK